MENTLFFALPGNERLTERLALKSNAQIGKVTIRRFPDGESYVRVHSDVKGKFVLLVSTLDRPDEKFLPLYFLSETVKSLGANKVCLVAPYLAYMRQDKVFNPGEGVTANYFGSLLTGCIDGIITVDPHLHRIHSLSQVYQITNKVVHAGSEISEWIQQNVENPILIGPDAESKQWVSDVAKKANAPFLVLQKIRLGDNEVKVSIPEDASYKKANPVLVDDIISTAHTMLETIANLKAQGMKPPVCIGIHAVFANDAYQELLNAGVERVVTCNTIPHPSNAIDISDALVKAVSEFGS